MSSQITCCSSKERAGGKQPERARKDQPGFFRFKQNGRGYLVTNDLGRFCTLSAPDFKDFVRGRLDEHSDAFARLANGFFIRDRANPEIAARMYRDRYSFLLHAPTLHIVVVTLRCNYKCIYCQANRRDASRSEFDMTLDTARNVVDRVFESPARFLTLEFQGGEPLLNWPVVKFIVEQARQRNMAAKKDLRIALVTNLSLMTDQMYDFFRAMNVSLCTSLDGPEDIHNRNRPCPGANSYRETTAWIKAIREKERSSNGSTGALVHRLNALLTITRYSLGRLREIIDEYIACGFNSISLRKLSYLGLSGGAAKEAIGYSAEEFIVAWRDAMDYLLEVNAKGTFFTERGTVILLQKILGSRDPGFLDLRSPCGAGIGQMAYQYNGKVYSCDEARTLEDNTFLLGDVNADDYQRIAASPKIKTLILSSTLENFSCDECVYKPYCGTCPVLNLVHHGTLFPQIRTTDWCKVNTGMLDYIFEKLEDTKTERIFRSWIRQP